MLISVFLMAPILLRFGDPSILNMIISSIIFLAIAESLRLSLLVSLAIKSCFCTFFSLLKV